MRIEEIKTLIKSIGFETTYYQWPQKKVPPLPYIVWYFPRSNNFAADDHVYKQIEELNIELYTAEKNFTAEAVVENVLDGAGFVWDKSETYLKSEDMYEVLYEMEVTING